MPAERSIKRKIAFVDGQNLFYDVIQAFGYSWPNYDPPKLAATVAVHGVGSSCRCVHRAPFGPLQTSPFRTRERFPSVE